MKRILAMIAAALLSLSSDLPAQKVGTSALQFLKVMPTARSTGMGEAAVAAVEGIDAVYWNPAGLSVLSTNEFSTTYTAWLFDTRQYALGFGARIGNVGSVGLQFQMADFGEFKEANTGSASTDWTTGAYNPGLTGATFRPRSWVLGLSYARNLTIDFSTGLTVKYVYESLYSQPSLTIVNELGQAEVINTYSKTILFDFGVRYNTGFKTMVIGAAVQNFGSQVKFAREEFTAPMVLRLGISGSLIGRDALLGESEENRILLVYDMIQPSDYTQQMHAGIEYSYKDGFFARAGYKINYDSDGLTLGAGVMTDMPGAGLTVDYSYGSMGEYLGQVHRISLGVKLK